MGLTGFFSYARFRLGQNDCGESSCSKAGMGFFDADDLQPPEHNAN
jgi:hypothetical protein